jgi:hypothetical protein
MDYQLSLFQQNRSNLLNLLKDLNLAEANKIPAHFNNNIIWNAGHLLLSQQFLVYYIAGLPFYIPEGYVPLFGSNTHAPAEGYSEDTFAELQSLLSSTTEKLVSDYEQGLFKGYNAYHSDYFNVDVHSIDEAIQFNNYHEGVHFGYILALRKAIKS